MKRAASLEFLPRLFERDAATDDLNNIGSVDQVNNELLWYKSAHSVTNGQKALWGLFDSDK